MMGLAAERLKLHSKAVFSMQDSTYLNCIHRYIIIDINCKYLQVASLVCEFCK